MLSQLLVASLLQSLQNIIIVVSCWWWSHVLQVEPMSRQTPHGFRDFFYYCEESDFPDQLVKKQEVEKPQTVCLPTHWAAAEAPSASTIRIFSKQKLFSFETWRKQSEQQLNRVLFCWSWEVLRETLEQSDPDSNWLHVCVCSGRSTLQTTDRAESLTVSGLLILCWLLLGDTAVTFAHC